MAIQSSGNLIADRRFDYARGYLDDGDAAAAVELLEQTLELVPDYLPARVWLGDAQLRLGDRAAAVDVYRLALTVDPSDPFGLALKIARMDGEVPSAPPPAYVAGLFDDYADRFDKALTGDLGYQTPWHLAAMIAGAGVKLHSVLDLGCGTGLMAEALAGDPADAGLAIDGIDLSAAMIEKARAKGRYRQLVVDDLIAGMAALPHPYDLVTAADVFVYVGELGPVFAAVSSRLQPAGAFAFSVEAGEAGITLQDSLRYAHSEDYIRDRLAAAGLGVIQIEKKPIRLDRGLPVQGLLVLCRAVDGPGYL